jgi:hypothetical protein
MLQKGQSVALKAHGDSWSSKYARRIAARCVPHSNVSDRLDRSRRTQTFGRGLRLTLVDGPGQLPAALRAPVGTSIGREGTFPGPLFFVESPAWRPRRGPRDTAQIWRDFPEVPTRSAAKCRSTGTFDPGHRSYWTVKREERPAGLERSGDEAAEGSIKHMACDGASPSRCVCSALPFILSRPLLILPPRWIDHMSRARNFPSGEVNR